MFGDLGTSPLYALSASFTDVCAYKQQQISDADIIGIVSMVFWSLLLVPTIKYCVFVLRADNHGEGGTFALLALLALLQRADGLPIWLYRIVVPASLLGAGLLIGSGVLTPAISVLSAVEGISVQVNSATTDAVVLGSCCILLVLFLCQRFGTGKVGGVFGPAIFLWMVLLGALGIRNIALAPHIWSVVNPLAGLDFFLLHGSHAYGTLGLVVLSVTGVEVVYADMSHFGKKAVRVCWAFCYVCLTLQYLGQGAFVLASDDRCAVVSSLFFRALPLWIYWPMFVLATVATVIASQASITGSFIVISQAVHMQYLPRVSIVHTSDKISSRVYLPLVNWLLCATTLGVTIGFRTSESLANAYGLTVCWIMLLTTGLVAAVMYFDWKWSKPSVLAFLLFFGLLDSLYSAATLMKIAEGGWVPMVISLTLVTCMATFRSGNQIAARAESAMRQTISPAVPESEGDAHQRDDFRHCLATVANFQRRIVTGELDHGTRVAQMSVFFTRDFRDAPLSLEHFARLTDSVPAQLMFLSVEYANQPFVEEAGRVSFWSAASSGGPEWMFAAIVRVGFAEMHNFDVHNVVLAQVLPRVPFKCTPRYFFTQRSFVVNPHSSVLRKVWLGAFEFMTRNSVRADQFFHLPPELVMHVGTLLMLS